MKKERMRYVEPLHIRARRLLHELNQAFYDGEEARMRIVESALRDVIEERAGVGAHKTHDIGGCR